jgi:hypothetical protein
MLTPRLRTVRSGIGITWIGNEVRCRKSFLYRSREVVRSFMSETAVVAPHKASRQALIGAVSEPKRPVRAACRSRKTVPR